MRTSSPWRLRSAATTIGAALFSAALISVLGHSAPGQSAALQPARVIARVGVEGSDVRITVRTSSEEAAGASAATEVKACLPPLEVLVTEAPLALRGADEVRGPIATLYLVARPEAPSLAPAPVPLECIALGTAPVSLRTVSRRASAAATTRNPAAWAFFGDSAEVRGTAFRSLHVRLERAAGGALERWETLTAVLACASPDEAEDLAERIAAGPPRGDGSHPDFFASGAAPPNPRVFHPGFFLRVNERGVYAVSRADLRSIGWTGGPVQVVDISLTHRGAEVPVWFVGSEDGWLDADPDAICFYADPVPSPFAATDTYWLSFDAGPGLALTTRPVVPSPAAASQGRITQAGEANREYWVGLPNGEGRDHWFWNRLRAGELIAPASLAIDLRLVPPPTGAGTLILELQGKSPGPHELAVELNGALVGSVVWVGAVPTSAVLALLPEAIVGGTNRLRLSTRVGSPVDLLYLDRLALAYQGSLNLTSAELAFAGETTAAGYRIGGLTGTGLTVLDTTDPVPVRLAGIVPESASATFADSLGGRSYFAFAPDAYRRPAIDLHRPPAFLGTPGADYLAVAPAAFRTALEPLLAHHRGRGHTVAVVEPEEAYAAFGEGEPTPAALRALFDYTISAWSPAPRYVLLVGDATYDYHGFLGPPPHPSLPTLWVETPNLGQMGSDNALADITGDDGIPEFAIGRLPGRTVDEIAAAVGKTLAYAQVIDPTRSEPPVNYAPWLGRLHVVADDGSAANPFEAVADRVSALAGDRYAIERSYLTALGSVAAARRAIEERLAMGSLLTIYVGHGNVTAWAAEELFTVSDANALRNGGRTPIVLALNCLNGYFTDAEAPASLAEALVQNPAGGAVGVWAPAGLGYLLDEEALAQAWIEEVFRSGERTVGDAILRAKARHAVYPGSGSNRELIDSYTWFGDPALAIALPAPDAPLAPEARATTAGIWLRFAPGAGTATLQVLRGAAADLTEGDLHLLAEIPGDRTSFVDRDVASGTSYRYALRTVDGAGFMSPPSPVVLATAGEITGDGQPPTIRLESAACVDRSRSLRAVIADEDGVACERLVVRRSGAPLAPGAWSASCTAAIEAEVAITIPIGGEDTWPGAEHAIEIGAEDGSGQGTVHEAQVVVCAPLQALRTTFAARPGRGTIALDLAFSRPVTLEVTWVSALGRLLRKDLRAAGAEHHVVWDGRDSNGKPSASGVYWIRMRAQAESGESWKADRKAVLLR